MIRVLLQLRDVVYQSSALLSPDSLLPEKPLSVVKCLYRAYQVEDRTLAGQLQCFIAFELLQFEHLVAVSFGVSYLEQIVLKAFSYCQLDCICCCPPEWVPLAGLKSELTLGSLNITWSP